MATTLMDIARRAGISHSVVSKVLNGGRSNVGVNRELRGRIEQLALEMGYRPDSAARALRKGRFDRVGVLAGGIEANIYLPQATLAAMTRRLSDHGYTVSLICAQMGDDLLHSSLMRSHQVDSLVLSTVVPPTPQQRLQLQRLDMPMIWMHQYDAQHCVGMDEAQAATLLVEHLVQCGHQRIQFIDYSSGLDSQHTLERLKGYQRAMAQRGLEPLVLALPRLPRLQRPPIMAQWLRQPHRPSAVIVNSCTSALTLLQTVAAAGLRVPEDLAIATFDDATLRDVGHPDLTAALSPCAEVGLAAADMILARMANPQEPLPSRLLPFRLQVGGSTVPGGAASPDALAQPASTVSKPNPANPAST